MDANCSFNSSSDFYKDPILCFNLHPDYFCFIDYAKAFDCVDHNKLWKILKEMGKPDLLTCLLRNLYEVKKQQLEPDMERWTDSKSEKEYVEAVYCHLAYLTYTSCEMPG